MLASRFFFFFKVVDISDISFSTEIRRLQDGLLPAHARPVHPPADVPEGAPQGLLPQGGRRRPGAAQDRPQAALRPKVRHQDRGQRGGGGGQGLLRGKELLHKFLFFIVRGSL